MSNLSLIEIVKAGDYVEAEKSIKMGSDINQQDEQGWTPLNFAAGKGDISMVRLMVENGADIFKMGRDRRTPYMIALGAGRVSVMKYLKEVESQFSAEKPSSLNRKYCKAYPLSHLRQYPMWSESRINWKGRNNGNGDSNGEDAPAFADDKIVFVHQDFTVTESIWHDENVIFNNVDSAWREFCATSLKFKCPDDFDFILPSESNV